MDFLIFHPPIVDVAGRKVLNRINHSRSRLLRCVFLVLLACNSSAPVNVSARGPCLLDHGAVVVSRKCNEQPITGVDEDGQVRRPQELRRHAHARQGAFREEGGRGASARGYGVRLNWAELLRSTATAAGVAAACERRPGPRLLLVSIQSD